MDIILLIIFSETLVLFLYFKFAEIYFFLTIVVFVLYFGLKYIDGDEYTGARSWRALRKFTLNKSVEYSFVDQSGCTDTDRLLYVVVGNITNFSLISAFGLHGNVFGTKTDINFILPPILFKVPLLRDLLLWIGAVTYEGTDKEHTVLELLKRNKSVAYCPAGMNDLLKIDDNNVTFNLQQPPIDVFEFVLKNKINIVPVLIQGETERYAILTNNWIRDCQRYFLNTKLQWPFPFLFFVRIFGKKPPPKVQVFVGPIINTQLYNNDAKQLSNAFMKKFESLSP